jgi:hypothetical protein
VVPRTAARLLAPLSVALGVFSACLDLTPVEADTPGLPEGGLSDSRVPGPCEACAFGGSTPSAECATTFAGCEQDAVCNAIIVCMRETGCFEVAGGEAVNRCGVPCVLGAGVNSPTDPALAAAVDVAGCAFEACPDLCFPEQ